MNYSILQFTTRRVIAAKDQLIHNIYIYIYYKSSEPQKSQRAPEIGHRWKIVIHFRLLLIIYV